LYRECHLWVDSRTRTAGRRLHVTADAAVQVHPWSHAIADIFRFLEILLAGVEVLEFIGRQIVQRLAGARCSRSDAGIRRLGGRGLRGDGDLKGKPVSDRFERG
jgi:hypothetical protein